MILSNIYYSHCVVSCFSLVCRFVTLNMSFYVSSVDVNDDDDDEDVEDDEDDDYWDF